MEISIHASRGGSDRLGYIDGYESCISIHASRGGSDLIQSCGRFPAQPFQSTLPAGEATEDVEED